MAIYRTKNYLIVTFAFGMWLTTTICLSDRKSSNDTEDMHNNPRVIPATTAPPPWMVPVGAGNNFGRMYQPVIRRTDNQPSGLTVVIITSRGKIIIDGESEKKNKTNNPPKHSGGGGPIPVVFNLTNPRDHDSDVSTQKNERIISMPTLKPKKTFDRADKTTEGTKKPAAGSTSTPVNVLTYNAETNANVPVTTSDPRLVECFNSIISVRENEFRVWNNFTVSHQNVMYDLDNYRVNNWGIQVCNSSDLDFQRRWRVQNVQRRIRLQKKMYECDSNETLFEVQQGYFTLSNNFTLFVMPLKKYFLVDEYFVMNESAVRVCTTYFNDYDNQRQQMSSVGDAALDVISDVGLSLSLICLMCLMITYSIFSKLRSLPGKNLMSLSTSLLLFYVVWFIASGIDDPMQPSCKAVAVTQHYLSLTIFTNMAIIAYHSRKTFAKNLPERRECEQDKLKAFVKNCVIGWGLPAIFLATFVSVDELNVVKLGYGDDNNCWIDSKVLLYFFVLPSGCVLVFNFTMFSMTIYHIRSKQKASNQVFKKSKLEINRQSVSIFLKLCTLKGFSWLFGVLTYFFPDVNAFPYIFVILSSLEGVYIALAFVFTKKVYGMYRETWQRRNTRKKQNGGKRNNSPESRDY